MADLQKTASPNFTIENIPSIQVREIRIKNFKAYKDYVFNFSDKNGNIKRFLCFIGGNGTGKSTVLNILQLLFQRYEGYTSTRVLAKLATCVRHTKNGGSAMFSDNDFLLEGDVESSIGNYTLRMNKNGFIDDHPKSIKEILYRIMYYARFDKELDQFQLVRSQWINFKKLFESVTGYEIEEIEDIFSGSSDPIQASMMSKYVLGFTVKKPFETIHHKECSNGEKKVIKSFSTLLNLEFPPKIILIDDIAMHVALNRHMALINAMQECYPDSQVFSTTHSYRMAKNLKRRSEVYDLRLRDANIVVKNEPTRLRIVDEIDDALYKLEGLEGSKSSALYNEGKKIRESIYMNSNDLQSFEECVSNFLKEVSDLYVKEVMSCDK